ncbi:maleylpyruvate isomerase family mycothiol-dependent enzyme [Kitasatospora sp. McL0602]|uniref:maleylpyruvate isomerase family mycothiol-dependent enzyme n=1 Tax=Kitasatospora sp. McL0602 TaxID=3439530 RepID=UPI003F88CA9A
MDQTEYMHALRRDGARMAEAAAGRLDLQVPSCPDWTVAELLRHTGRVHRFWTAMAEQALADPSTFEHAPLPDDAELVEWFAEGVETCAAALEVLDPALPRWTWASRKDVGFIQRRMAQETAVHCWDALAAAGRDEPVEQALARDGVDEFFAYFTADELPTGLPAAGFHLHATDGPGEWSVRAVDGAWAVTHEHGKGAAAVRGTASDLLLLLWQRRSPGQLETFGDEAALAAFLTGFDLS